jgi:hypothetical protein
MLPHVVCNPYTTNCTRSHHMAPFHLQDFSNVSSVRVRAECCSNSQSVHILCRLARERRCKLFPDQHRLRVLSHRLSSPATRGCAVCCARSRHTIRGPVQHRSDGGEPSGYCIRARHRPPAPSGKPLCAVLAPGSSRSVLGGVQGVPLSPPVPYVSSQAQSQKLS